MSNPAIIRFVQCNLTKVIEIATIGFQFIRNTTYKQKLGLVPESLLNPDFRPLMVGGYKFYVYDNQLFLVNASLQDALDRVVLDADYVAFLDIVRGCLNTSVHLSWELCSPSRFPCHSFVATWQH